MKKLLLALALIAGVTTVQAQQATTASTQTAKPNPKAPRFKFEKEVHDFGTLKEGPQAEYKFRFTNTGKEPLIIQNVSASCGCTTPEWPKAPILPGKKGEIVVRYNTQGRVSPFEKEVYISSNAVNPPGRDRYMLKIKGTVVAAEAAKN